MLIGGDKRHLPSQFAAYMELELLSPLGKFLRDGSDLLNIPDIAAPVLSSRDQIVVLGGYLGDSTESYQRSYQHCSIHVLEPIRDYFVTLRARFKDETISLHEMAAWVHEQGVTLAVSSDSTGMYASGYTQKVKSVDLAKFLDGLDSKVGILEVNVEGAEYDLLPHILLNCSNLPKVIFVQFHQISPDSYERKREVCEQLGWKYKRVFSYEWVWERWDLI
jgi:FkbM family methyltransferase